MVASQFHRGSNSYFNEEFSPWCANSMVPG